MAIVTKEFAKAATDYLEACIPEDQREAARDDLRVMYQESGDREGLTKYLASEAEKARNALGINARIRADLARERIAA